MPQDKVHGRQKFIAVREALQSANPEVELAGLADRFGSKEALAFWRSIQPRSHRNAEAHRRFMEHVSKMTPHEVFLSSVQAGIHYDDGRLRPPYDGSSGEHEDVTK